MKKWIKGLFVAAVALLVVPATLTGCGKSSSGKTVKLGVVGSDEQQTWQPAVKKLKKEGINLQIVSFNDYNQPNTALKQKQLDLNAYQTKQFLNNWNKSNHTNFKGIGDIYLVTMGIYSHQYKTLKDVKKGSKVTLPNDLANEARALKLLEKSGLIKLDNAAVPNVKDVKQNKLNLKLTPLDAAQVARSLSDSPLAVVNGNFATDSGLHPKQALFAEKFDKSSDPYINVIAANGNKANDPTYKKVVKAYQTTATEKKIQSVYKGSCIPVWNSENK